MLQHCASTTGKGLKIAVISVGGTISTYLDKQNNGIFRVHTKEDITSFFEDNSFPFSWTLFSDVTENAYFLTLSDWESLYEFIKKRYHSYDGFVVLQETDSLIFASSLFSYLFSDCGKPIIFTSSPVPIGDRQYSNRALQNIYDSLYIAAADIGEVCIVSHGKIFRPTRTIRKNIMDTIPFSSYQTDELGGVQETVNLALHRKHRGEDSGKFLSHFPTKKVAFFKLMPSDSLDFLRSLHPVPEVLVIETLGYGSLPDEIISLLENISKMGTYIVLIAQYDSLHRSFTLDNDIQNIQQSVLLKNMTVSAVLAKSYIALENTDRFSEFEGFMTRPVEGDSIEE